MGLHWPAVIVAGIGVFLLYPFRLHIVYDSTQHNTQLVISLLLFRNKLRIPLRISLRNVRRRLRHILSATQPQSPQSEARDSSILRRIHQMIHSLRHSVQRQIIPAARWGTYTARHIDACDEFVWRTTLGTGDAAETALLVGTLWSVKHMATSTLSHMIYFPQSPVLHVEAEWDTPCLQVQFSCIFRFRIGKLTIAWLIQWLRYGWKGARSFG